MYIESVSSQKGDSDSTPLECSGEMA